MRYGQWVMDPNTYSNHFPIRYFVHIFTLVTGKLQVVCGRSTYRLTALLFEMSIMWVRAGYEIWMASNASKHTLQSFSYNRSWVYSLFRHITWKVQVIFGHSAYRTTAMLLGTFLMWFRVALEIRLESYGLRHASLVLWYNIVCIPQACIYITIW